MAARKTSGKSLICGIGINDADYIINKYVYFKGTQKCIWTCPFYSRWSGVIKRCYSENALKRRETYTPCIVSENWKTFSNFKAWMEKQDWQGMELDKDILSFGSKIYSEDTCCFVPQSLNCLLLMSGASRGQYPVGVSERGGKYRSKIRSNNKLISLGTYLTIEKAHKAWQEAKIAEIEKAISSYRQTDQFNSKVADALLTRAWKIRIDIQQNRETKIL